MLPQAPHHQQIPITHMRHNSDSYQYEAAAISGRGSAKQELTKIYLDKHAAKKVPKAYL